MTVRCKISGVRKDYLRVLRGTTSNNLYHQQNFMSHQAEGKHQAPNFFMSHQAEGKTLCRTYRST
jgi:hypothetical protein